METQEEGLTYALLLTTTTSYPGTVTTVPVYRPKFVFDVGRSCTEVG